MSQKIAIHASKRDGVGKGASRRLRRSGDVIPAIMYGSDQEAVSITLGVNEINKFPTRCPGSLQIRSRESRTEPS